ncbi:MAG: hypothetical protein GX362_02680 [Methanosarcinaceae archaeon]|nr:hypothetical protein [Methanosarcinaceae archaeon]
MSNNMKKTDSEMKTVSDNLNKTPDSEEQKRIQKESLAKSVIGMIIGLTSGILCYLMLGEGTTVSWILLLLVVSIFAYYMQRRAIFPLLKLDKTPIKTSEWLGNIFLVIIYCVVIWTILLNIGTPVWILEPEISDDESFVKFGIDREAEVSYIILDYEEKKRKDINFENATNVSLKEETVMKNGKTDEAFVGVIDETPKSGEMMYIKASKPAFSFNDDYAKTVIYGPIRVDVPEDDKDENNSKRNKK